MLRKLLLLTLSLVGAAGVLYLLSYWVEPLRPHFIPLIFPLVALWSILNLAVLDPLIASQHKYMVLIWLVIVVAIAPYFDWMEAYASIAIPISLIILALSGASLALQSLLGRAQRFLQGPVLSLVFDSFAVVLSGILVLFVSVITAPAAVPPETFSNTEELHYLVQMDQDDRQSGRILLQPQRDEARLVRVLKLNEENGIRSSIDKYHAAVVLNHGVCPQHYELAFELANQAAVSGVEGATGLAREAYDRWMLSFGRHRMYQAQDILQFGRTCPAEMPP